MLKRALLLAVVLGFSSSALCRVLIFTYAYNRPDFIEIQARTSKVRDLGYFTTHGLETQFCDDATQTCRDPSDWLLKEGFDQNQVTFLQTAQDMEFFGDKTFLHYRGGTNWNYQDADYHRRKTQALNTYIEAILSADN